MRTERRTRHTIWLLIFGFLPLLFSYSFSKSGEVSEKDSLAAPVDTVIYELGEVVVTGTRYKKKIIDIPYSIRRVSNSEFQFARKAGVNDVLSNVPGLFMQSRYGNHDVRISIRGFGSRSNSGIRGVRILLDGIPESEPDGQTRIEAIDFNSIGSIEIVKGNASSLYPNAPGGVINFINDTRFQKTHVLNFNDFGSFDLRRNGFKAGIRTKDYAFLLTYSYHNSRGFRDHSADYWHIVNTVLETEPNEYTQLQLLGYFVDGEIRLPGSLTREELAENPFQAAQREKDFDFRRLTKKGRLGVRFTAAFDRERNNELEITLYGTIKFFNRTSRVFRIINRYGLGASFRFVNKSQIAGRRNEFSVGGDLLNQTGPIEFYKNIGGKKSDVLTGLTDETIGNVGFFFQNSFDLLPNRLNLLVTGRFDKILFDQKNQLLAAQNDHRNFEAFTPKVALNYKLTPAIALYTSAGFSFESPGGNELDNYPLSSQPGRLINPDLKAQEAAFFETGIKGGIRRPGQSYFKHILFETTLFNYQIDNEIVPFEVFSDVFFRNSAQTNRFGIETGGDVELVNGLNLNVAYTFSDFQYDNYTAEAIELDNSGNIVTNDRDFSGNIVPSVPRHNLMLSLSKSQRVAPGVRGFAKVDYQNISGLFVDDANSDKTENYQLWNTTLGFDISAGRFSMLLSGGVNNLSDESYVGFVNINSASGRFYEAGSPRNYFGTVKFSLTF